MFLGYYKYILKDSIISFFRNFLLRSKGQIIGRNCKISSDLKIFGKANIRDNVRIGRNVILNDGVIIGSNAKLENIEIGENSHIEGGVLITGYGNGKIKIGRECYIGIYNVLDWSDNIIIGDYVHIAGPSTGIWTHSSAKQAISGLALNIKDINYRPTAPVIIENNVYIGGNCTIYPGVKIGHHSIVAPNSAVTKDVEPYTMVGGVPAKKIKDIEINKIIE